MSKILHIPELDTRKTIHPYNVEEAFNPSASASKIVIIGKPGTGKTTLITSLMYAKRHLIPAGVIISGTEDSNHHYASIFPSTFVYSKYDEKIVKGFVSRQKTSKEYVENPWGLLLLDDCTDDPKILNTPLFQNLYKNGRHYNMLFILSLQYCMDIRPNIRTNIDGVFILRETNLKNRKSLYENYAGVIPSFHIFCELMDQVANNFTALYIHNAGQSNDWQDCVFWYKAPSLPQGFRFGSDEFWDFHYERYNTEYKEPLIY